MSDKPKPFTIQPEGTMTMKIGEDGSISSSSDEPMTINLDKIKSVGIENLVDVRST